MCMPAARSHTRYNAAEQRPADSGRLTWRTGVLERALRARLLASVYTEPAGSGDAIRLRLAAIELLGQTDAPAPSLRLPADIVRARLAASVPLLDGIDLPVVAEVSYLFGRLAGVFLADPNHKGAATAILTAVQRHRLHIEQMIGEAIVSHEDHLAALASAADVDSGLLAVLADLASRPPLSRTAARLQPALKLGVWQQSYCPVCGARPIIGERDRDVFRLRCGRCTTLWVWALPACPVCGDGPFGPVQVVGAEMDISAIVLGCGVCHIYLKALDSQQTTSLVDILLFDLATWTTDLAALGHGFAAPGWRPRRLEHGDPAGEDLDDD